MVDPLRVIYSFPDTLGKPGIGTTAYNQVCGLVEAGVEVDVFCTFLGQPVPAGVRVTETLSVLGQRVPHRALGGTRAYLWHDRVVARAVATRPCDVVHVWPRGCLRTLRAARAKGIPSFRESPSPHTAAARDSVSAAAAALGLTVPVGHSHFPDPQTLAAEVEEFEAADYVLAPSDYVMRTFTERRRSVDRIVRHRYGFDPVAFPAPPAQRPDRPFTAAFLGRLEPNKGVHFALDAWIGAGLAEVGRLDLYGRTQPDFGAIIAGRLSDAHAVEHGFITDTGGALRAADVLLLPSVTEGSALVVFEAMASGAVPLVSDVCGAPVVSGTDGFVHPVGDVAALTDQLRTLSTQPARLAQMRAQALVRREELSWTTAGRILSEAYREGIARYSARPARR